MLYYLEFTFLGNFSKMSTRKLNLTHVAGLGRWKRDTCRGRDWGWEVWAHTVTGSRGTAGTAGPGRAGGGAAGLLPQLRNTHSPDRHRILSMSGSFLYTRCGRNPGKEVEVKGASATSPGLMLTLWTARLSSGCLPAFGVAAVHTQAAENSTRVWSSICPPSQFCYLCIRGSVDSSRAPCSTLSPFSSSPASS